MRFISHDNFYYSSLNPIDILIIRIWICGMNRSSRWSATTFIGINQENTNLLHSIGSSAIFFYLKKIGKKIKVFIKGRRY